MLGAGLTDEVLPLSWHMYQFCDNQVAIIIDDARLIVTKSGREIIILEPVVSKKALPEPEEVRIVKLIDMITSLRLIPIMKRYFSRR